MIGNKDCSFICAYVFNLLVLYTFNILIIMMPIVVGSLKNPYVVFFDCTRETLLNRLKTRIQESQANLAAIAGTNDAAHSDKILRSDDNFETIGKRFDVFERDSMPSIEYYRNCCSEKCGNFLAINCNDSVSNIYSNFAAFLRKI